jgi:hypothetical protein
MALRHMKATLALPTPDSGSIAWVVLQTGEDEAHGFG